MSRFQNSKYRKTIKMGPKSNVKTPEDYQNPGGDVEYVMKRERNNVAVRRSREKTRQKQKETLEKVNRLRSENQELEMKVNLLSKELSVLRDLFLEHAGVKHHTIVIAPEKSKDDNDNVNSGREECPVNTIAAKMDHEYSSKPFSRS